MKTLVRQHRKLVNMTVDQLASASAVGVATIHRIELTGYDALKLRDACRIALVLNVGVTDLFCITENFKTERRSIGSPHSHIL
jgi:DNA-binding XRE family transcriptional regulator